VEDREEQARRLIAQARGKPDGLEEAIPCQDEAFRSEHPTLAAFLFTPDCSPGKEAITASLSIFYDGGALKAVLNDRGADRSLWAAGLTFSGVLDALEARLNADFVEWRRNRPWKGKRG